MAAEWLEAAGIWCGSLFWRNRNCDGGQNFNWGKTHDGHNRYPRSRRRLFAVD
jgi:hypothetical protein